MLDNPHDPRWQRLAHGAQSYLRELFHDAPRMERWSGEGLPYLILDKYVLLRTKILGRPCVFMAMEASKADAPAHMARHWATVDREVGEAVVIILTEALSHRQRQALIRSRTPFMAPRNQFFAPQLGLDLREHFKTVRAPAGESLSPTSQVVVLASLLGEDLGSPHASALARRFGYTPMSMSRAIDELEAFGLATVAGEGRKRNMTLTHAGRELWERALPALRSPVRKRRAIDRMPHHAGAKRAGENAAAVYTMLSPPAHETWAIAARDWKLIEPAVDTAGLDTDRPAVVLETWNYDPAVLTRTDTVDPLSLYLSLDDRRDDRISVAAEELIEAMPWS